MVMPNLCQIYEGKLLPDHPSCQRICFAKITNSIAWMLSADGLLWAMEVLLPPPPPIILKKSFRSVCNKATPYDGIDVWHILRAFYMGIKFWMQDFSFRNVCEVCCRGKIEPNELQLGQSFTTNFKAGDPWKKIRQLHEVKLWNPIFVLPFWISRTKVQDVYRAAEFIKELKEF